MNTKINALTAKLWALRLKQNKAKIVLESKLKAEWWKVWDAWPELKSGLANLEASREITSVPDDEYFHVWVRFHSMEEIPADVRSYFEEYLQDRGCAYADWENSCLTRCIGEAYVVQDDCQHRRDNGVWLGHRRVIFESAYRDEESGAVDTAHRNSLIEAHMEMNGCFPDVVQATRHGDVRFVDTLAKAKGTV